MISLLCFLVKCYQKWLSPLWPGTCRFYPTCSNYMLIALKKHGLRGLLMGFMRLLRCHPFSQSGVDTVPDTFCLKRQKIKK